MPLVIIANPPAPPQNSGKTSHRCIILHPQALIPLADAELRQVILSIEMLICSNTQTERASDNSITGASRGYIHKASHTIAIMLQTVRRRRHPACRIYVTLPELFHGTGPCYQFASLSTMPLGGTALRYNRSQTRSSGRGADGATLSPIAVLRRAVTPRPSRAGAQLGG